MFSQIKLPFLSLVALSWPLNRQRRNNENKHGFDHMLWICNGWKNKFDKIITCGCFVFFPLCDMFMSFVRGSKAANWAETFIPVRLHIQGYKHFWKCHWTHFHCVRPQDVKMRYICNAWCFLTTSGPVSWDIVDRLTLQIIPQPKGFRCLNRFIMLPHIILIRVAFERVTFPRRSLLCCPTLSECD